MGMNPELVDAALRKKPNKTQPNTLKDPVLIDNLEPLENIGVISELLKVIKILKLNCLHITL